MTDEKSDQLEGRAYHINTQTQPGFQSRPTSPLSPSSPQSIQFRSQEEPAGPTADEIKEQGNVSFKAKRYNDAINLYTKAIDMQPTEPSYLTNRAAAYMALKCFRLALADCQQATTLQPAAHSSKILTRFARCHLALGSTESALTMLGTVIASEPNNATALQLREKSLKLDAHLRDLNSAKSRNDWGMARLTLDKCLQSIEGEGSEVPMQWRLWKVEVELALGNWDAADSAAIDAMRLYPNSPEVLVARARVLFLSGKLPQAIQHAESAILLDPEYRVASSLRQRIKDVERMKEEGNTAFKSNGLREAVALYTRCIHLIGEAEEEGKGGQIRGTLLSNRATALVKLGMWREALVDAEASLSIHPTSFKTLRTRARIHRHFKKFDAAIMDFKSAITQAKLENAVADVESLGVELKRAEGARRKDVTNILESRGTV